MNSRSTATPRLTVPTGAGFMAVAALGAFAVDGLSSESANATRTIFAKSATVWQSEGDFGPGAVQSANTKISYPIIENWDETKHMGELRDLIAKKAARKAFTAKDASRLSTLQSMRRETLPQAMSYEEFVREQDRREELVKLTEALMAYERKYGAIVNG